ncbi:MAG: hypothetical protein K8R59_10100 [Thermoanaerobaculales bacterium]|nr:hypothetical protein [Thermoanaerobaculales bacterium]
MSRRGPASGFGNQLRRDKSGFGNQLRRDKSGFVLRTSPWQFLFST